MTFEAWLVFMGIWTVATLPLGPNALNCMATSACHGFCRALWSVAGVFLAGCTFMMVAVSGVAVFLLAHPALFEILRWCGVSYLVWIGFTLLQRPYGVHAMETAASAPAPAPGALFRSAALISMTNPKAIFGWLAIISQFISPEVPLVPQLLVLTPSALSVLLVVYIAYCAVGRGAARLFTGARQFWFDRGAGSLYLIFPAGLAVADLRRS